MGFIGLGNVGSKLVESLLRNGFDLVVQDLDRSAAAQLEADEAEVRRLAGLVTTAGRSAVDCPVSGGCHRAATGNISIFAGCDRFTFERILPVLVTMGRHILHTGRWAQPRSSRWSPTTWLPPTWCPCAKL